MASSILAPQSSRGNEASNQITRIVQSANCVKTLSEPSSSTSTKRESAIPTGSPSVVATQQLSVDVYDAVLEEIKRFNDGEDEDESIINPQYSTYLRTDPSLYEYPYPDGSYILVASPHWFGQLTDITDPEIEKKRKRFMMTGNYEIWNFNTKVIGSEAFVWNQNLFEKEQFKNDFATVAWITAEELSHYAERSGSTLFQLLENSRIIAQILDRIQHNADDTYSFKWDTKGYSIQNLFFGSYQKNEDQTGIDHPYARDYAFRLVPFEEGFGVEGTITKESMKKWYQIEITLGYDNDEGKVIATDAQINPVATGEIFDQNGVPRIEIEKKGEVSKFISSVFGALLIDYPESLMKNVYNNEIGFPNFYLDFEFLFGIEGIPWDLSE